MTALKVIDGKPVNFEDINRVSLEWPRGGEPILTVTYSVAISFEEEVKDLPEGEPIAPTGQGTREFELTGQDALSFLDKYRILIKKAKGV